MRVTEQINQLLAHLREKLSYNDFDLPNLFIQREDTITDFNAVVYNPVVCLILQGSKITAIGDQITTLHVGDILIVSHDLPVQSKITSASLTEPYLALVLSLDLSIVRSLYEQVGPHLREAPDARSLSNGPAEPVLIESIARYLALQNNPLDACVLGPTILREIHFRLLMSHNGGMLRSLLSVDSHASRISMAILKLREEFRRNLAVTELAQIAGMSQSSFHGHFKTVTGTTPLQYQKDLRMITARDLLRSGNYSVSSASFEVGYESPSHFCRDYQRKFGISPSKETATELEFT